MKKNGMLLLVCLMGVVSVQPSVFKTKKPKQPTVQDIKIDLAQSLSDLHAQATQSIRDLTRLIDEIACRGTELAGGKDGLLSTNDKDVLMKYQQRIALLQSALLEMQSQV